MNWTLNGSVVGNNSNTYQTSTVPEGDVIKVGMQSSLSCASSGAVYQIQYYECGFRSNASVSMYASQTSICTGWMLKIFMLILSMEVMPPIYQWKHEWK
jgi:hypothetical protein